MGTKLIDPATAPRTVRRPVGRRGGLGVVVAGLGILLAVSLGGAFVGADTRNEGGSGETSTGLDTSSNRGFGAVEERLPRPAPGRFAADW